MPRKAKKIEEEVIDNDVKVSNIEEDTDKDTLNKEAENIEEMKLTIYEHEYTVSELINMKNKENKTYLEKETINRFNELMYNYYRGIKHSILKECCGKTYSINELKSKLNDNVYEIIDRRMSRKDIRFDKTTVDTVIKYIEEAEK